MTSFTWKTSMVHDTYRWCHGGKGNCRKATAMKKKLMRTGRRMARAHKGWPAWKSFPDKKRSENVSTVGRTAPKTTIWPRRTTSDAFIIFCCNTKNFFCTAFTFKKSGSKSLKCAAATKAATQLVSTGCQPQISHEPAKWIEFSNNCQN